MIWKALKSLWHGAVVSVGAVGFTALFFLVLPLMQAITSTVNADTVLQSVSTADVPPPPAPPEEEPEEEPEPEEPPPQIEAPPQQLDLAQLELALNPGFSDGLVGGGAFAVKLSAFGGGEKGESVEELFSLADLDQKPRVLYQPGPVIDAALKKKSPATVHIVFVVDQRGKVENPLVQKSSDPAFERAALGAVKQWKFEPGKRGGKAVRFRMRVPITFPAHS
jgi:protein TonB